MMGVFLTSQITLYKTWIRVRTVAVKSIFFGSPSPGLIRIISARRILHQYNKGPAKGIMIKPTILFNQCSMMGGVGGKCNWFARFLVSLSARYLMGRQECTVRRA